MNQDTHFAALQLLRLAGAPSLSGDAATQLVAAVGDAVVVIRPKPQTRVR